MRDFISKLIVVLIVVLSVCMLMGCRDKERPVITSASNEHLIPIVTEWETEEELAEDDIPFDKPALSAKENPNE